MTKTQIQALEGRHPNNSPGAAHLTLNEIVDMLGLTRERVRQIEAKALLRLRKKMPINGIKISDVL